jgi:hypothetical protein
MNRHARSLSFALLVLGALAAPRGVRAQADTAAVHGADTTQAAIPKTPPKVPAQKKPQRFYCGGGISLTFGSQTRVGISPLVGYRLTKAISVGTQLSYEYLRLDVRGSTHPFRSYGGSLFGRYHPVPQLYAHVEPALFSQEFESSPGVWTRGNVSYLFVGGGALQPIAPGLKAYVQVTFDLLDDPHSPYQRSQSFVTTGIAVGL